MRALKMVGDMHWYLTSMNWCWCFKQIHVRYLAPNLVVSASFSQQERSILWLHCVTGWKMDCIRKPLPLCTMRSHSTVSRPKFHKTPQSRSCNLMTVWLSLAGLVHQNFLNTDGTIITEMYCQEIDEIDWKLQRLGKVGPRGMIWSSRIETDHYLLNNTGYK